MAGYASQGDYENELLASYRRRGRLPVIRKRDVNLALSIYKVPKRTGMGPVPRKLIGDRLTTTVLKKLGVNRRASDSQLMSLAARTVLAKDTRSRAQAAKAKARIRRQRRRGREL